MTERSADQQPKSYSELRHHASQLEKANERIPKLVHKIKSQATEIKRLHRKVQHMTLAARVREAEALLPVSREELAHENQKLARRLREAEQRVAKLKSESGSSGIVPPILGEMTQEARDAFVSEFNGNGKAAE